MRIISHIFERLKTNNRENKLLFYDRLGFNLTVAIRSIWSNPEISDKEKIEKIIIINELSHQVFNWTWRLRKGDQIFNDLDCLSDIQNYATKDKHVAGEIGLAITASYWHLADPNRFQSK